jgi:hypothetical protein
MCAYFFSSFSLCWVISNFVTFYQIKIAKHICDPYCHLGTESVSWFILIGLLLAPLENMKSCWWNCKLSTRHWYPRIHWKPIYTCAGWFSDVCERDDNGCSDPTELGLSKSVVPKLLRLSWMGYPLYRHKAEKWGYLVPKLDPAVEDQVSML